MPKFDEPNLEASVKRTVESNSQLTDQDAALVGSALKLARYIDDVEKAWHEGEAALMDYYRASSSLATLNQLLKGMLSSPDARNRAGVANEEPTSNRLEALRSE